jgi:hypothetical protein
MRRGVSPLAVAGFSAAVCLLLVLALIGYSAAAGLAGDGCQGHGVGRSYHQSFSLVPTGTDCDFFQRSTGETSSALVVPWAPITWLVPTLILSAIAFLTMGVLGRLLHRQGSAGTIPSQGT